MEINLNNMGVRHEPLEQAPVNVEGPKTEGKDLQSARPSASNLRATSPSTFDAIRDSEPVADVPDSALSRDDELGKLVNAAFALPPPPMPNFVS